MPPLFGSRWCSDGREVLTLTLTAVSTGVSCHGKWTIMLPYAGLLTGGFDHVHAFISVPDRMTVFED